MLSSTLVCLLLLSLSLALVNGGIYPQKHPSPRGCDQPASSLCSRANCNVWYVSPLSGNDTSGTGSKSQPWRDISNVINTKILGNLTQNPPVVLSKGPIQGGDVIVIMDGIVSINIQRISNEIPVTITKEPGTSPVVNGTYISTAKNFVIACLNITTLYKSSGNVVDLISNGFFGTLSDITILNNTISSFQSLVDNDQDLMNSMAGTAVSVSGTRNRIIGNYIYNVRRGVSVSGTYGYIAYNHINYVFGDSFRVVDNHTLVEFNVAENSMNVDGGADHRDGLQMFTNGNKFSLLNITIQFNRFLSDSDQNRPYRDHFQGITGFDVLLDTCTVAYNLVASQTYHGIALFSSINSLVIGNTILDPTGKYYLWITFDNKDGRPESKNNTVINNFMNTKSNWTSVVFETGNVAVRLNITQLAMYFNTTTWRPLPNVPGSPLGLGNGSTIASKYYPQYDNTGHKRSTPYDVGAYNQVYADDYVPCTGFPQECSNHGTCTKGTCSCDNSWTGSDCGVSTQPPSSTTTQATTGQKSNASGLVYSIVFVILAVFSVL